eukprot:TRINITY_DN4606_c0_g4_i3.p1 TRINITY_DN4606_c0_g4~~TRINITY_DN4606_c0_g4_i3.p1  ORF type:complete len:298 (+),score=52.03 TRINITY_DN4606_c0_g4_i3:104-997(+)
MNDIRAMQYHLSLVPVSALVVPKLIDGEETELISVVFQRLLRSHILSLPVYTVKDGIKQYFGFVDIMDILYSFMLNQAGLTNYAAVRDIINLSSRNPWLFLHTTDDLLSACSLLSGAHQDSSVHRCAVFDVGPSGPYMFSILSQSKLVEYIGGNLNTCPLFEKTIEELKIGFRKVRSVNISKNVIVAFEKLKKYEVSGLAVVDNSQRIVGNISASDLKDIYMLPKGFSQVLNAPIREYLIEKRKKKPIFLNPKVATLADAYQIIITRKIHRVYLVDQDERALGLITLTDLLAFWTTD